MPYPTKLERNIDIYLRVKYGGESYTNVANLYHISPQRVQQIIYAISHHLYNKDMIYLNELENI